MSDDQQVEQPERYGSSLAQMFGYVTPEDRGKWAQQRAQNKPRVNAVRQGVKSGMSALMEFGDRNIRGKLDAAHRVAAQQQFDETHDKITSRRRDPGTRSIIETVDYEPKDNRETIEPDLDLEM